MKVLIFLSEIMIPLVLFYIAGFGILSGRPVFDDFLAGAKEGMKTVAGILPTLIGLMTAVGILRASGLLDFLGQLMTIPAALIHFPAAVVPVLLVRLISNSAATGLMLDIFKEYGTDSYVGMVTSVMMSCTETLFYCMSLYFGTAGIKRTRYTLAGALIATGAGVAASVVLTGILRIS
ncbi:MAG TPA: spore maturation protein [Candidatus Hungatella pullicola]|nr:spore maturation protein [Candidatus Hungatella pullicola]